MCLISEIPASRIAEEDIECFKFYISVKPTSYLKDTRPFLMSPYAKSKVYSIPCWLDDYGKHIQDNYNVSTIITKCREDNIFRHIIEKGYIHSCLKIAGLTHYNYFLSLNTVIVRCKIPKGSEYFISFDNESLCSKELILERIIYPNEWKEFSLPSSFIDDYKAVFDYETIAKFCDECKDIMIKMN